MDGWYSGNESDGYSIGRSDGSYNGKPVFFLKSNKNIDSGYGTIVKNIMPPEYLGKRVKLTGNIEVNSIYGAAGMWMRVDGGAGNSTYGNTLSFDNMGNRQITQKAEWKKYEIILNVPKESRMIFYGMYLSGIGEIALSDFAFEIVGNDVPRTDGKK